MVATIFPIFWIHAWFKIYLIWELEKRACSNMDTKHCFSPSAYVLEVNLNESSFTWNWTRMGIWNFTGWSELIILRAPPPSAMVYCTHCADYCPSIKDPDKGYMWDLFLHHLSSMQIYPVWLLWRWICCLTDFYEVFLHVWSYIVSCVWCSDVVVCVARSLMRRFTPTNLPLLRKAQDRLLSYCAL
jgi:hypothetical protein